MRDIIFKFMYFGKFVFLIIFCLYFLWFRCDIVVDWIMNLFIFGRFSFMVELFVLYVFV